MYQKQKPRRGSTAPILDFRFLHTSQNLDSPTEFDTFLCYNLEDSNAVKKIGLHLQKSGLKPWLDEWELRPGVPWQRLLERQISKIHSVAVFIGGSGVGPWQRLEVEAFLHEFLRRGCPIIPVILPSTQPIEILDLPVFLRGMKWVDFRKKSPNPMQQLIWGITGNRSKPHSSNGNTGTYKSDR